MHVPRQNIEFTPRDKTRDRVFATRVLCQSMENRGVYYTIEYGNWNSVQVLMLILEFLEYNVLY
jgi:hypothetical protein